APAPGSGRCFSKWASSPTATSIINTVHTAVHHKRVNVLTRFARPPHGRAFRSSQDEATKSGCAAAAKRKIRLNIAADFSENPRQGQNARIGEVHRGSSSL